MATSNPAFSQSAAFNATASAQQLEELYNSPSASSAETDRMTVEDTIRKTAASFGILLVGAVVGWWVPGLWIVGAIAGLVLAFVNIFRNRKKLPSAGLTLAYAAAEGLFVGGISKFYEAFAGGVVVQAVLATIVVVGVTLALFATGKIRASARATKVFLAAMIGYLVFSLVNLVLIWTGAVNDPWGLRGSFEIFGIPLGVVIGVLVVIMCAYSLVLDFDMIQQGVKNRAPRAYGWAGAFGIMVTVVWLYLELLRIFAIARN
ncbi:Bax inhibitor-1/YccA family protein [Leifsonia shinshuensis]|uniref:Bax inhibitor-1/YccA family protein n=1 Tax=Leifsonia shinshuensis TaxID=150026 RepID=UPI001F514E0F|nr:Bax inhibitor-1/YccA family protein [Leifsonia shinshuensis]MCI0159167.1 Bax inhibitor-1/YccA family protein [Leifsonia shinshuensis]